MREDKMITKLKSLFGSDILIYTDRVEGMTTLMLEPNSSKQMDLIISAVERIAEIADEYDIEQICVLSPSKKTLIPYLITELLPKPISPEVNYTYKDVEEYHYSFSHLTGHFFRQSKSKKDSLGTEILFQPLTIFCGRRYTKLLLQSNFARLVIIGKQLELATLDLPMNLVLDFPWSFSRNYAIKLKAVPVSRCRYKLNLKVDWDSGSLPKDNIVFRTPNTVAYSQKVLLTND